MNIKKIQYISSLKINIPMLKSKGRGLNLPLIDHFTGKQLPSDQQIIMISEDEFNCLVKCWGADRFKDLSIIKAEEN